MNKQVSKEEERLKRQIKWIADMGKVLTLLSKDIKHMGKIDKENQDLLKKVGADVLYFGTALSFTEDNL